MEIVEVLKKIGLDEKNAKVYLALLELGTSHVSDIAKKAGIKRPTCYLIIDELKNKGLVTQVPAKVNLFTAESPEKLAREMYKKQELYKRFLPNMLALHNAKKEKPEVRLFEGMEGIRQVYEKIYSSEEVLFFGTPSEILKIDPDALWTFVKKVKILNLKVKDILPDTLEHRKYAKEAKIGMNYEIRFLPKDKGFLTDSAIFGDSVVFFSFRPQIFGVMISSKEISESLRALYFLAWGQAVSY